MSYDGYLTIDTGGGEMVDVVELGNYTTNVAPMWGHALEMAGEDIRLSDTGGRLAGDVVPLLRKAVAHMQDNPATYKAMNPANNWGDYEGALKYLSNVVEQCAAHPNTTLRWWV